MADRTATTSTWRNSDGTLSVRSYLAPHFYKSASSGWQPISTELAAVPGHAGWWQNTANSVQASFGPANASGGAERLTVGGAQFGFTPVGVSDPAQAPSVSGSTVTYRNLWPNVDVREQVSAAAVKEEIVIGQPGSATSVAFRVQGAVLRANHDGGLDVIAGGRKVGVIPPLTVVTQATGPGAAARSRGMHPADPTKASGARLTVTGDVMRISVSARWLASLPRSAFPVVIDPSFGGCLGAPNANPLVTCTGQAQMQLVSVNADHQVLNGVFQVGQGDYWRASAYFTAPAMPAPEPGARPWQLSSALFTASIAPGFLTDPAIYGMSNTAAVPPAYDQIPWASSFCRCPLARHRVSSLPPSARR